MSYYTEFTLYLKKSNHDKYMGKESIVVKRYLNKLWDNITIKDIDNLTMCVIINELCLSGSLEILYNTSSHPCVDKVVVTHGSFYPSLLSKDIKKPFLKNRKRF